jgi:hypothetical protein
MLYHQHTRRRCIIGRSRAKLKQKAVIIGTTKSYIAEISSNAAWYHNGRHECMYLPSSILLHTPGNQDKDTAIGKPAKWRLTPGTNNMLTPKGSPGYQRWHYEEYSWFGSYYDSMVR